jgi:hypothetical protein
VWIVGFFFDEKCYKIVFSSWPGKSAVIQIVTKGISTPVPNTIEWI